MLKQTLWYPDSAMNIFFHVTGLRRSVTLKVVINVI
jgi:hypothetical protein